MDYGCKTQCYVCVGLGNTNILLTPEHIKAWHPACIQESEVLLNGMQIEWLDSSKPGP